MTRISVPISVSRLRKWRRRAEIEAEKPHPDSLTRAAAKLTRADLAYDMDRLIFHDRRAAKG